MTGDDLSNQAQSTDQLTSDQLTMVKLVFDISRRFASTLDLSNLLSEVLSLTVDTLKADRGSIFLFGENGHVSRHILARRNLPVAESEKIVSEVMDKGLAGWSVRHRQVALVQDTKTDPRWHHLPGTEWDTRSAIAVPFVHRGQVNGLLTLMHHEPHAFTQQHLELVSAIAGQAATAVENARLFTRVRDERAVLEALLNGVQEPIIVTDAENKVRYINPAAGALDERSAQAIGQPIETFTPTDKLNQMFQQLLTSGQPQHDEILWPDGRTFDVNLVQVSGVGSVAVLHDVTHFKELDRMKSEFVATVSHDLKSPLNVIYGYVELLKDALSEQDELAAQSLREIKLSAVRMKNLITTLLDLAQIESGLDRSTQPCQMGEIIRAVVHGYHLPAQEKEIRLKIVIVDDLPTIQGHPVRLEQAVTNLVGNAIKYTPSQGEITVSAQVKDHKLIVQVADTGPGIPPDKQAGLFGKFYKTGTQATQNQEGHGLGLAIVKSVIETHGGQVSVSSQVGQGSTFSFSLPLKKSDQ